MNTYNVTFIRQNNQLVAMVPRHNEENEILLGGALLDRRMGELTVNTKTGELNLSYAQPVAQIEIECKLHYV